MIVWDDWCMAKGYRRVERDQVFLFPPSMRDWLPDGHRVWLVIGAVEAMDTRVFHDRRRLGGAGAAGYDPDMLVTVLVWAYAHQVTSSRRIEQLCQTDVAFRVICAGNLPDHTTIARFRGEFAGAAAVFFAEVLGLCARLGMGKLGVVALDGTKVAASASKSANRTEDRLRTLAEETVAAHAAADAGEDGLFGPGNRGDEVPGDAWSPRSRQERIAAALRSLREEREAAEAQRQAASAAHDQLARDYLDAAAAGTPRLGRPPAGTEVELARRSLDRERACRAAQLAELEGRYAAGQPRRGRPAGIEDYCRVVQAAAALERALARQAAADAGQGSSEGTKDSKDSKDTGRAPVRNITDPDSRLMPVRGGGFIQGYNAQNVVSEDGLIIATTLTRDTGDVAWLTPMIQAAQTAAAFITARRPAGRDGHSGSGSHHDNDSDAWRSAGYQPAEDSSYAGPIGLLLADAGYCSEDNIAADGPPRLIATGKRRDLEKTARHGSGEHTQSGQHTTAMAAALATEDGITAYRHRGHISETPHGDIKHNKGFRQFSLRGHAKTSSEWQFTTATANLFKAITSGHLTHAALGNLTAPASTPAT
jgi:transposase